MTVLDTPERERDGTQPPPAPRRATLLALLIPGVVMLGFGLWDLRRQNAMGNDEVATRWIAGLPLHQLGHVLRHLDAVHGLYYLLIHGWMVFGRSPTVIRVPSLIAAVVGVVVVAVLARRLVLPVRPAAVALGCGVAAGTLAAASPFVSFYAQTARSYTMVYLVVAAATLVLVLALEREREHATRAAAGLWTGYAVLMVIGGYLNELSLLVLAAHLVTVVVARRGAASVLRWAAASVVAVIIVSPLIVLSRRQDAVLKYQSQPDTHDLRELFEYLFGRPLPVAIVVALLALVGVVAGLRRGRDARSSGTPGLLTPATVGVPLVLLPPALLWAYSYVATPLYASRYLLCCEIGVALVAGYGILVLAQGLEKVVAPSRSALGRGAVLATTTVVVLAVVLVAQLGAQAVIRRPGSRQFNFGGPSAFLGAHARPGDGVLFFNSFFRRARLGYPDDFRDTTDLALLRPPVQTATFQGRDKPFVLIRPLMLQRRRIWTFGRPPTHLGNLKGPLVTLEAGVLQHHFVEIQQRHYGKIHVTLWQRD